MKNLIFLSFLFISVFCSAQEAAYSQWQNYVITPKYDQLQAFGEAIHEHNKMYHQNAPGTASVWRVDSGPNVGKWVLSNGPHTFGNLDNMDLGEGHAAHWRNKVMPTIAKLQDGGIWRLDNNHSYLPDGMAITKARVIVHELSDDGREGYHAAMKKLTEATKIQSPSRARLYLRRVGFHDDKMDRVVFLGLNNWADLDGNASSNYEKVHGEGSWVLFIEEVSKGVKSSYEERWTHIPYLSGIEQ